MAWRYFGRIATGPYAGRWRVGNSIETIGRQVDDLWPDRTKASDGTLGNTAHQNRASDHNPNIADGSVNVVTAIDITDDDLSGADMAAVAEAIRVSHDPRVKYLIHFRRMFASYHRTYRAAWEWGPYSGTNAHLSHLHLSVRGDKSFYDDGEPWVIGDDMLTEEEAQFLRELKTSVESVGSNATFPQFLIPWFRLWRHTEPSDVVILSDFENHEANPDAHHA